MAIKIKRNHGIRTALTIVCCLMVVIIPVQSHALFGLSFDLFSFGPFSIGIDLPLKGVLGLVGGVMLAGAVISYFSGGSGYAYSASYPNAPPPTRHVKVTIEPDEHFKGQPLRVHLNHHKLLNHENQIPLPKKGYLQVDFETGKMVFHGVDFNGYVYFHYNRSLTVWDDQNNPMLVLTTIQENEDRERLLILQEKSEKAEKVVNILFGGVK